MSMSQPRCPCGATISQERLEALPGVTRCVACQSEEDEEDNRRERLERQKVELAEREQFKRGMRELSARLREYDEQWNIAV